jgi:hypothetical protein
MNKQEKENRKRPWLKQELFVITKDLNDFLSSNKTLTQKERRNLCIIQHTVLRRQKSDENNFASVHSTVWSNSMGSGYLKWINYLVALGFLKRGNPYSNQSTKDRGPFPKSCWIPGVTKHDPASKFSLIEFQKKDYPSTTISLN